MQDCGQPPADILEELAPGMEMGAGKSILPKGCVHGPSHFFFFFYNGGMQVRGMKTDVLF